MRKRGVAAVCAAASAMPSSFRVPGTPKLRQKRSQSRVLIVAPAAIPVRRERRLMVDPSALLALVGGGEEQRLQQHLEVAAVARVGIPQLLVEGALVEIVPQRTPEGDLRLRVDDPADER